MAEGEAAAWRFVSAVALPFIIASLLVTARVTAWAGNEVVFPRPKVVEPNVEFWVKVFTRYTSRDFIIFDRDDVSRVYQVMHLPGDGDPTSNDVNWTNAYLKTKYGNILNRLAAGAKPMSFEEQQVAALFHNPSPSVYAQAAQNLRVQQGLRDRFREGLLRSRYYRPTMERIFRAAGLPVELVTLAEVESGFYPGARSGAGAVGIWQFTRSTGKQFLRINRRYDERLNPIRETQAAAQLLRYNYDVLGNWPLAITAYNYGTYGTAQAAEMYDNDYAQVFKNFDGPHFGFAAKNYYSEFLAALEVSRHEAEYFPGIEYDSIAPPPQPSTVLWHSSRARIRRVAAHRRSHSCTGRCTVSRHSRRIAES